MFCPVPEDRAFLLGAIADEARPFCVAVVAGEVAGFFTARIDLNERPLSPASCPSAASRPWWWMRLRSWGIGWALIAHGDQWGKARGASQLRLEVMVFNEAGQGSYERLGFKAQSQTMAR